MLHRMRKIANKKGFTLIELLIAIFIVGVLCAIAVFQFRNYHVKSANAAAVADLCNTRIALEVYFTDYHAYP